MLDQPRKVLGREPEQRHHDERHERELPRQDEERTGEEDDPRQGGEALAHAREDEALDGLHVAGEAGDQVAEAALAEGVERQPVQVTEEARAQAHEEALAHPRGEVVVAEARGAAQEREAEVGKGERKQRRELARHEHVVHDELEEPDLSRLEGRYGDEQEDPRGHRHSVRPHIGPEAAHDVAHRDDRSGGD
jgi:hypothetical protein